MNHLQTGLRVGVDLTSVDDVERSVARFGDRYVRRIFTLHEIETAPEVTKWPRPAWQRGSLPRRPQ